MIHAAADNGEITRQEAELLVRSLLSAGFDTTVHGLGAAIRSLAMNPDQFAALRADPSKARAAFEEAVRLESPVQTFFGTTTRDVALGGTSISEGEKELMPLGAANRDRRKWRDPDRYDIDRSTAGHVGFGSGVHMCVGQLLARLEGEALLGAIARAFSSLEPDAALQQHVARLDEDAGQGDDGTRRPRTLSHQAVAGHSGVAHSLRWMGQHGGPAARLISESCPYDLSFGSTDRRSDRKAA